MIRPINVMMDAILAPSRGFLFSWGFLLISNDQLHDELDGIFFSMAVDQHANRIDAFIINSID